jgi:hypothetical protein
MPCWHDRGDGFCGDGIWAGQQGDECYESGADGRGRDIGRDAVAEYGREPMAGLRQVPPVRKNFALDRDDDGSNRMERDATLGPRGQEYTDHGAPIVWAAAVFDVLGPGGFLDVGLEISDFKSQISDFKFQILIYSPYHASIVCVIFIANESPY